MLRVWEDVTESEVQQVSGMQVLIRLKVRPEAFPTGSPLSFWTIGKDEEENLFIMKA